jgi:hypothetical protein
VEHVLAEQLLQASPPAPLPLSLPATAKVDIPLDNVFVLHFGQATESLFAALTSSSKSPRHFEHVYSKIGISIFP